MPYIPPRNRPPIDKALDPVAERIAAVLAEKGQTVELSEQYRVTFMALAAAIANIERKGAAKAAGTGEEDLAASIVKAAEGYHQKGGWLGELNYAITRIIQAVPYKMVQKRAWSDYLKYWMFAETIGALTRTAYDIHSQYKDDWIGNGLAGVFEDVKDEYKRRVNTAYEAAQIRMSGDVYDLTSFRTSLVEQTINGVKGFQEVMLPQQNPPVVG